METNLLRLKYLKMRTLCIYFAAFYPICQSSQAELRIDVTQGRADPMPIAVTIFKSEGIKNKILERKSRLLFQRIWSVQAYLHR